MADTSKLSLSLGANKSHHPNHKNSHHRHSNGTKRPHSALHDSDDSDDEGKHQEITHFDSKAGGAVHEENFVQEKKPLVIPVGEDRRKRQKGPLPSQNTEAAEAAAAEAKAKAKPTVFGLNVKSKDEVVITGDANQEDPKPATEAKKKTADEEALAALLGQKASSNAVIPTLTDEETFHRDYDNAPDVPTADDYDAVPIEEFGAAMLRGMGWKDGEGIGRNKNQPIAKPRMLERRAELLGVGAKPAKALGIELGEWGKHAKKHERKIDMAYAPVMLKNKKTGEMITEEEMKERMKDEEALGFVEEEEPSEDDERDRRRDKERRIEKERDRSRERDSDRKHKSSSRRDRSRSYDDSGRERRERRREKERRRRDRSESEDRYRSRRDDKYRDKPKDRDDRYRDSDRDRRRRDDDRSSRKEKSYKDRSDRDRNRR